MIRHIDNDYAVKAEEVAELCDNGKTGDAKVVLCCGPRTDDNEWLFFLATNGDDVLLTDDAEGTAAWIKASGQDVDELIYAVKSSPADEISTNWAVEQLTFVAVNSCGTCGALITGLDAALEHLGDEDCDDASSMPAWPADAVLSADLYRKGPIWSWDCRTPSGRGYALAGSGTDDARWVPCRVVDGIVEHDPSRDDVDSVRSPSDLEGPPAWEVLGEEGARETLAVSSLEEATPLAIEWVREGAWDTENAPAFVDADILNKGKVVKSIIVVIKQTEPRCVERYEVADEPPVRAHEWIYKGVYGGEAGGVNSRNECNHCGCIRTDHSRYQRRDTGATVRDVTTYQMPE